MYCCRCVILDMFSRSVVGWMLAQRENARLAGRLIAETVEREGIERNQLILHSDRGAPMKAGTTAQLLAHLEAVQERIRTLRAAQAKTDVALRRLEQAILDNALRGEL
jgi:transposase InsO family protein